MCRLLDIQELLSDSGIGRELHVVVGQGQLDSVLQSRPEDRRAYIEEAAGVLKHRKRKEKALRKLDAMQANLTRLTDLTAELRRQLKPLGRQAEIARRAQTVQSDLRDARLRVLGDDLTESAVSSRRRSRTRTPTGSTLRREAEAATRPRQSQQREIAPRGGGRRGTSPCAPTRSRRGSRSPAWPYRVTPPPRIATERVQHLDAAPDASTGPEPDPLTTQARRSRSRRSGPARRRRPNRDGNGVRGSTDPR